MIIILFVLFSLSSCLSKTLLDTQKTPKKERVTKEILEIIRSGDSKQIIAFYKEEARNNRLGQIMSYPSQDKNGICYIDVNHATLLLGAFPLDKDLNEQEEALKYLFKYMNLQPDSPNYIDPNAHIGNAILVCLITSLCSTETLESFIDTVGVDKEKSMCEYMTPLMIAIGQGNADKVELLLKKGAKLCTSNNDAIPIAYACWIGNVEILKLLWEQDQLLFKNQKQEVLLFQTKMTSTDSFPSVYAGVNNQGDAMKFLISVGAAFPKRRAMRILWAKKLIFSSILNFSGKAISATSNAFGFFALNFLSDIMQKSATQFLALTVDQTVMLKAQLAFSAVNKKGEWMLELHSSEPDFELINEGIKKMLTYPYSNSMKVKLENLRIKAKEFKRLKKSEPNPEREVENFKIVKNTLKTIIANNGNVQLSDSQKFFPAKSKYRTLLVRTWDNVNYTPSITLPWLDLKEYNAYLKTGYNVPSFEEFTNIYKGCRLFGQYWTSESDFLGYRKIFNNEKEEFLPCEASSGLVFIKDNSR